MLGCATSVTTAALAAMNQLFACVTDDDDNKCSSPHNLSKTHAASARPERGWLRMASCSGGVWKGETHFRIIPLPSQTRILPGGVNCYYYYITSKIVTAATACVQVGIYLGTGVNGRIPLCKGTRSPCARGVV